MILYLKDLLNGFGKNIPSPVWKNLFLQVLLRPLKDGTTRYLRQEIYNTKLRFVLENVFVKIDAERVLSGDFGNEESGDEEETSGNEEGESETSDHEEKSKGTLTNAVKEEKSLERKNKENLSEDDLHTKEIVGKVENGYAECPKKDLSLSTESERNEIGF